METKEAMPEVKDGRMILRGALAGSKQRERTFLIPRRSLAKHGRRSEHEHCPVKLQRRLLRQRWRRRRGRTPQFRCITSQQ